MLILGHHLQAGPRSEPLHVNHNKQKTGTEEKGLFVVFTQQHMRICRDGVNIYFASYVKKKKKIKPKTCLIPTMVSISSWNILEL